MKIQSGIRSLVLLAAAIAVVAGCGVANPFAPASTASSANSEARALKWAQCMRSHGVNVADPGPNGTVRIQANAGANGGTRTTTGGAAAPNPSGTPDPNGGPPPEIQAAMDACKQYAPNGGLAGGPPSQAQIDAATKFTQCMRDHGIPVQDPQAGSSGIRIGGGGPNPADPNSDQFRQAQQACQHYLDQARPKS
jgi:hypothetical protein